MPRPQFRLRSLFILTGIIALGCWTIVRVVRHWTVVAEYRIDDEGSVLRKYGDGRATVTDHDNPTKSTTREMKREGKLQIIRMPNGNTVKYWPDEELVEVDRATPPPTRVLDWSEGRPKRLITTVKSKRYDEDGDYDQMPKKQSALPDD
jgi:hypothetical protein